MRIRSRLAVGVRLDMTPMIDIVFQLLVFFAMTLQIAAPEGDLAMHPSLSHGTSDSPASFVPPLLVVLRADPQGGMRSLELNGRPLAGTNQLHREIERLVGNSPTVAAATEARLACDRELSYEHTIAAVTALSGSRLSTGETKPLVGKVRFVELK